MADFVQTMKDWRRMCKALGSVCCDGCKLHIEGNDCVAVYEGEMDYAKAEKAIMAWSAEHPEPVYPTWGEWLHGLHVVGVHAMQAPLQNVYYPIEGKMNTPIPADIAQKLGLQPKEG